MIQHNFSVAFTPPIIAFVRPLHPLKISSIEIRRRVAKAFGISVADLIGPSRLRKIAYARFAAYDLLQRTGRLSTTQIGLYLGGRDHSTVMHGIKRCRNLQSFDPDFAALYEEARRG